MHPRFGLIAACVIVAGWTATSCIGCGARTCSTAQDCDPGEICGLNHLCQDDPNMSPCSGPQDCGANQTCGTDGFCHNNDAGCPGGPSCPPGGTCSGPQDCGNNQFCGPDNLCHDNQSPDVPCVNLQCRQVQCSGSTTTTLTGSVYDPSGQVALYNAIVYVPNKPVEDLPQGLTCDQCGSLVTGSPVAIALTGPDGKFELKNVPIGPNIPLVIQVGKWRRQVMVPFNVQACQTQPITDASLLHLPRHKGQGDIPQMAIATADWDRFECLLRKMGIDYSEMTHPAGNGRIHFYRDDGLENDAGYLPDTLLLSDAGTLAQYDVVLLPCRGDERFSSPSASPWSSRSQNLINYTSAGGRLFATHYSYVWMSFGQSPWQSTGDWVPDPGNSNWPPDPFTLTVNQSFPKGQAFAEWLYNVGASPTLGQLSVNEPRHDLTGWDGGQTGAGGGTTPWLWGINPNDNRGTPSSIAHITFNTPYNPPPLPDGDAGTQCGRVVFSDFHVTAAALNGGTGNTIFPRACSPNLAMTAQEKALVFMLFDVSSCVQSDTTAPDVCKVVNDPCTQPQGECCSGLQCVDNANGPCFEGTCSCQIVIN